MANPQSKFSLRNLLESLRLTNFFTPTQIRNYFIVVPSIALLFVLIYVPVKLYKNHRMQKEILNKKTFTPQEVVSLLTRPGVGDLVFPDNLFEFAPAFAARAGEETKWSIESVEKYWADPSVVGISKLPERNQKLLEDYLEKAKAKDKNF